MPDGTGREFIWSGLPAGHRLAGDGALGKGFSAASAAGATDASVNGKRGLRRDIVRSRCASCGALRSALRCEVTGVHKADEGGVVVDSGIRPSGPRQREPSGRPIPRSPSRRCIVAAGFGQSDRENLVDLAGSCRRADEAGGGRGEDEIWCFRRRDGAVASRRTSGAAVDRMGGLLRARIEGGGLTTRKQRRAAAATVLFPRLAMEIETASFRTTYEVTTYLCAASGLPLASLLGCQESGSCLPALA